MTFLPIVARELRVAARRRATYWSRSVAVLGSSIIGSILYLQFRDTSPHELGQTLFIVIAGLAFVYCLLAGIRSTADCLSEEKREGTLGLLFLTDLKGYDVVGGKLVATSLNAFYGLMAIFPVLAVPLLMGGITNGEFWRTALVLVNTFVFSLAAGMFISSISKYPRKAIAGTFLLVLLFSVGLPLVRAWVPFVEDSRRLSLICAALEPSSAAQLVPDRIYVKSYKMFWMFSGIIHGLCWLFLGLACVIVPRSWQDHPAGIRGQRWRERWRNWSFGDAANRQAFRKRLLDINAFLWLAARDRLRPVYVWLALLLIAALWTWGTLALGKDWAGETSIYVLTAMVLNTMFKLWVASEACRQLGEDRKNGALELLLSTPLTVPDILRGQFLALRRQFLAPLTVVLGVEVIFMVAGMQNGSIDRESMPGYLSFWAGGMIMLVGDMLALSAVGMWVGLTARNPNRAMGITVARVLVLPLIIGFGIFIVATLVAYSSSNYEPGWKFMLTLWFGLGMVSDAIFGLGALRRLQTTFREMAVQRFAPDQSFWSRLFGKK